MDHVYSMLKSDFDDVVLREICTDWGQAFPDLIRFV